MTQLERPPPAEPSDESIVALSMMVSTADRARLNRRPRSPERRVRKRPSSPKSGPEPRIKEMASLSVPNKTNRAPSPIWTLGGTTYAEIVKGLNSRSSSVGSRQSSVQRQSEYMSVVKSTSPVEDIKDPISKSEDYSVPVSSVQSPIYEQSTVSQTYEQSVPYETCDLTSYEIASEIEMPISRNVDTYYPTDVRPQEERGAYTEQSDVFHQKLYQDTRPEYRERDLSSDSTSRIRSHDLSYAEILALGLRNRNFGLNPMKEESPTQKMTTETIATTLASKSVLYAETPNKNKVHEKEPKPKSGAKSRKDFNIEKNTIFDSQSHKKKKLPKKPVEVENFNWDAETTQMEVKVEPAKHVENKMHYQAIGVTQRCENTGSMSKSLTVDKNNELGDCKKSQHKSTKKKSKTKKQNLEEDDIDKALKEIEATEKLKRKQNFREDEIDKALKQIEATEKHKKKQKHVAEILSKISSTVECNVLPKNTEKSASLPQTSITEKININVDVSDVAGSKDIKDVDENKTFKKKHKSKKKRHLESEANDTLKGIEVSNLSPEIKSADEENLSSKRQMSNKLEELTKSSTQDEIVSTISLQKVEEKEVISNIAQNESNKDVMNMDWNVLIAEEELNVKDDTYEISNKTVNESNAPIMEQTQSYVETPQIVCEEKYTREDGETQEKITTMSLEFNTTNSKQYQPLESQNILADVSENNAPIMEQTQSYVETPQIVSEEKYTRENGKTQEKITTMSPEFNTTNSKQYQPLESQNILADLSQDENMKFPMLESRVTETFERDVDSVANVKSYMKESPEIINVETQGTELLKDDKLKQKNVHHPEHMTVESTESNVIVGMNETVLGEISQEFIKNEQNNNETKLSVKEIVEQPVFDVFEEVTVYKPLMEDIKTHTIYLITHEEKKLPPIRKVKISNSRSVNETLTQDEDAENSVIIGESSEASDILESKVKEENCPEGENVFETLNMTVECGDKTDSQSKEQDIVAKVEDCTPQPTLFRGVEEKANSIEAIHDLSSRESDEILEPVIFGSVKDRQKLNTNKDILQFSLQDVKTLPDRELIDEVKVYSLDLDRNQLEYYFYLLSKKKNEVGDLTSNTEITDVDKPFITQPLNLQISAQCINESESILSTQSGNQELMTETIFNSTLTPKCLGDEIVERNITKPQKNYLLQETNGNILVPKIDTMLFEHPLYSYQELADAEIVLASVCKPKISSVEIETIKIDEVKLGHKDGIEKTDEVSFIGFTEALLSEQSQNDNEELILVDEALCSTTDLEQNSKEKYETLEATKSAQCVLKQEKSQTPSMSFVAMESMENTPDSKISSDVFVKPQDISQKLIDMEKNSGSSSRSQHSDTESDLLTTDTTKVETRSVTQELREMPAVQLTETITDRKSSVNPSNTVLFKQHPWSYQELNDAEKILASTFKPEIRCDKHKLDSAETIKSTPNEFMQEAEKISHNEKTETVIKDNLFEQPRYDYQELANAESLFAHANSLQLIIPNAIVEAENNAKEQKIIMEKAEKTPITKINEAANKENISRNEVVSALFEKPGYDLRELLDAEMFLASIQCSKPSSVQHVVPEKDIGQIMLDSIIGDSETICVLDKEKSFRNKNLNIVSEDVATTTDCEKQKYETKVESENVSSKDEVLDAAKYSLSPKETSQSKENVGKRYLLEVEDAEQLVIPSEEIVTNNSRIEECTHNSVEIPTQQVSVPQKYFDHDKLHSISDVCLELFTKVPNLDETFVPMVYGDIFDERCGIEREESEMETDSQAQNTLMSPIHTPLPYLDANVEYEEKLGANVPMTHVKSQINDAEKIDTVRDTKITDSKCQSPIIEKSQEQSLKASSMETVQLSTSTKEDDTYVLGECKDGSQKIDVDSTCKIHDLNETLVPIVFGKLDDVIVNDDIMNHEIPQDICKENQTLLILKQSVESSSKQTVSNDQIDTQDSIQGKELRNDENSLSYENESRTKAVPCQDDFVEDFVWVENVEEVCSDEKLKPLTTETSAIGSEDNIDPNSENDIILLSKEITTRTSNNLKKNDEVTPSSIKKEEETKVTEGFTVSREESLLSDNVTQKYSLDLIEDDKRIKQLAPSSKTMPHVSIDMFLHHEKLHSATRAVESQSETNESISSEHIKYPPLDKDIQPLSMDVTPKSTINVELNSDTNNLHKNVTSDVATNTGTPVLESQYDKSHIHSLHELLPELDSIPEFKPSSSNTIFYSNLSADAPEFKPAFAYKTVPEDNTFGTLSESITISLTDRDTTNSDVVNNDLDLPKTIEKLSASCESFDPQDEFKTESKADKSSNSQEDHKSCKRNRKKKKNKSENCVQLLDSKNNESENKVTEILTEHEPRSITIWASLSDDGKSYAEVLAEGLSSDKSSDTKTTHPEKETFSLIQPTNIDNGTEVSSSFTPVIEDSIDEHTSWAKLAGTLSHKLCGADESFSEACIAPQVKAPTILVESLALEHQEKAEPIVDSEGFIKVERSRRSRSRSKDNNKRTTSPIYATIEPQEKNQNKFEKLETVDVDVSEKDINVEVYEKESNISAQSENKEKAKKKRKKKKATNKNDSEDVIEPKENIICTTQTKHIKSSVSTPDSVHTPIKERMYSEAQYWKVDPTEVNETEKFEPWSNVNLNQTMPTHVLTHSKEETRKEEKAELSSDEGLLEHSFTHQNFEVKEDVLGEKEGNSLITSENMGIKDHSPNVLNKPSQHLIVCEEVSLEDNIADLQREIEEMLLPENETNRIVGPLNTLDTVSNKPSIAVLSLTGKDENNDCDDNENRPNITTTENDKSAYPQGEKVSIAEHDMNERDIVHNVPDNVFHQKLSTAQAQSSEIENVHEISDKNISDVKVDKKAVQPVSMLDESTREPSTEVAMKPCSNDELSVHQHLTSANLPENLQNDRIWKNKFEYDEAENLWHNRNEIATNQFENPKDAAVKTCSETLMSSNKSLSVVIFKPELSSNLQIDKSFWTEKHLYHDAECYYFACLAKKKTPEKYSQKTDSNINDRNDKGKDPDGGSGHSSDVEEHSRESSNGSPFDSNYISMDLPGGICSWRDETSYLSVEAPTDSSLATLCEHDISQLGSDFREDILTTISPPTPVVPTRAPQELNMQMSPDHRAAKIAKDDLSNDIEGLLEEVRHVQTRLTDLPDESLDAMEEGLREGITILIKCQEAATLLEKKIMEFRQEPEIQPLNKELLAIKTRIIKLLSQAQQGLATIQDARTEQSRLMKLFEEQKEKTLKLDKWLENINNELKLSISRTEFLSEQELLTYIEILEKYIRDYNEYELLLQSIVIDGHDVSSHQLREKLKLTQSALNETKSLITIEIGRLKQALSQLKSAPDAVEVIEEDLSQTDRTIDSSSMPEEIVSTRVEVDEAEKPSEEILFSLKQVDSNRKPEQDSSIPEKLETTSVIEVKPLATIETQTGKSLMSDVPSLYDKSVICVPELETQDAAVTCVFPSEAEVQTRESDEKLSTEILENIQVRKILSEGHETIEIASKPVTRDQPMAEGSLHIDATYEDNKLHKDSQLNITHSIPQSFETIMVEPDETTTEVVIDADGTKRIIVRKVRKTFVTTRQTIQTQQTSSQLLSTGMVPEKGTFSQIVLTGDKGSSKPDDDKHIEYQTYGGQVISGLPGRELTIQEFSSKPDMTISVDEKMKPEEILSLAESSVQPQICTSSSSITAVVQQVTKRIIKTRRRIIKRVVIIDGKEHVTEEVIEEPDDIEIFEEEIPRVSIKVRDNNDVQIKELDECDDEKNTPSTSSEQEDLYIKTKDKPKESTKKSSEISTQQTSDSGSQKKLTSQQESKQEEDEEDTKMSHVPFEGTESKGKIVVSVTERPDFGSELQEKAIVQNVPWKDVQYVESENFVSQQTIVSKKRQIIRKIQIVNGKQIVTEEIVEDPDETLEKHITEGMSQSDYDKPIDLEIPHSSRTSHFIEITEDTGKPYEPTVVVKKRKVIKTIQDEDGNVLSTEEIIDEPEQFVISGTPEQPVEFVGNITETFPTNIYQKPVETNVAETESKHKAPITDVKEVYVIKEVKRIDGKELTTEEMVDKPVQPVQEDTPHTINLLTQPEDEFKQMESVTVFESPANDMNKILIQTGSIDQTSQTNKSDNLTNVKIVDWKESMREKREMEPKKVTSSLTASDVDFKIESEQLTRELIVDNGAGVSDDKLNKLKISTEADNYNDEKTIIKEEPEKQEVDIANKTKNLIESEIQHATLISPNLDISLMSVDNHFKDKSTLKLLEEKEGLEDKEIITPERPIEPELKTDVNTLVAEPSSKDVEKVNIKFEVDEKNGTSVLQEDPLISDNKTTTIVEKLLPEVKKVSNTQTDILQHDILPDEEKIGHEKSVKTPMKSPPQQLEKDTQSFTGKSVIEETRDFLIYGNRAPEFLDFSALQKDNRTGEEQSDQSMPFTKIEIEENSSKVLPSEIFQETFTQINQPLDDKKESDIFLNASIINESSKPLQENVDKKGILSGPCLTEDDKKVIAVHDLPGVGEEQKSASDKSCVIEKEKPECTLESFVVVKPNEEKMPQQGSKTQNDVTEESSQFIPSCGSIGIIGDLKEDIEDSQAGNYNELRNIQSFILSERLNTEMQEQKPSIKDKNEIKSHSFNVNPEAVTEVDLPCKGVPQKTIDITMSLTKLDHKMQESGDPHMRVGFKVENIESEDPKVVKKDIDVDLPTEVKIITYDKPKDSIVFEEKSSQSNDSSENVSNKKHKRNKNKKKHKDDNTELIETDISLEADKSVLESESSSLSHYIELPDSPTVDSPKPTVTTIEHPVAVTDESSIDTEHVIEDTGYEPEDLSVEKSLSQDKSKKKTRRKHQISEETTYPKQSTTDSDQTAISTAVEEIEQTGETKKGKRKRDKKKHKDDSEQFEQKLSPKLGNEVVESPQKDESYHTISETSDVNTVKIVEECIHSSPESISKDDIHSTLAYTVPVIEGVSIDEHSIQTSPEVSVSHTEDVEKHETVIPQMVDFSLQTSLIQQSEIPIQTSPIEDKETFTQTGDEINAVEIPKISDILTTSDMIVQTSRAETPEQIAKLEATTQVIPHEISLFDERYCQTSPPSGDDVIKTEILTESRELQTSPIELSKDEKSIEAKIDTKEIDIQTQCETSERETLTSPLKTTELSEASMQTPEIQLTTTSTQSDIKSTVEPLHPEELKHKRTDIREQEVQVSGIPKLDNTQQTTPRGIFSEDSTSTEEPYEVHLRAQVSIPRTTHEFLINERLIQQANEPEGHGDLSKEKVKPKKSRKYKRKMEDSPQAQSPESLSDPITTELSISVTPTSDDQSSKEASSIDEGIYRQVTSFPIKYNESSVTHPKLSYSDVVQRSKSKSPSPPDRDLIISRKPDNVRLKEVLDKRTLSVSEPQQNNANDTLCLALLEPTVEQSYELIVNNEIDEVKKAIETHDNVRVEKSIIVVIETISIWLEEVQYKIYTKYKDAKRRQSDDSERFIIFKNYIERLKKIADETETNPEIAGLLDSLNKQMLAVTNLSTQSSSKAEENEGEWNKFVHDIDLLSQSVERVKISLDDLLISDIPTQHKLENLDKIEISNNENADRVSQLYRRFRNFVKIYSEKECPSALFSADDDVKQTENSVNTERDRLLQLSALAEEYEQTLQDFAQITDIAEALLDGKIIVSGLDHLHEEIQKHRKFFVNLSHCRAILESLEDNLDNETRSKFSSLHNSLHDRATSIIDRAASRAQQMTLAASRWTTLEQGMKEEQQWLRVAQQRVPDLTNVTSIDHEQYINLYQSIILDVSHHHAKMLRLLSLTESLQNLIVCSGIEIECSTALDTLLKLHEDIDSRLTRLTAFRENWLTYDHLIDRIESWMKTANREIIQITPENVTTTGNLRKFWELKAQHEVYNNLKNGSGVQFEKALEILPISDEMVQRQFFSKIEDEWQDLSTRIDNVHKTAIQNISDRDVSSGEKLNILEEEIKELRCSLEGLKGVIKSEDELNLYIERLQVMTSRIDRIQNELGRLSLLPTAESERLGALLSQSRILDDQIAEELERSLLLKEKIVQVQSGIARCQKNQRRARLTLEECEAAERLGSDVVERASATCNALMKDLTAQWQDILSLRQALHTLPTSLRVCVSPTGVERDISALQENHAQLEEACNELCQRLHARVQLWRRFERQLEQVQGAVREADYMVELLTVQGQVDYDRLLKATEKLETLSESLSRRSGELVGELRQAAAPLESSTEPSVAAQLRKELDDAATAYEHTCCNLTQLCDKYHRAVDLWKRYRDAAAAVRAFAEFQEGRLHALRPHDAPDAAKACLEQEARVAELRSLAAQVAAETGSRALQADADALARRLQLVAGAVHTLADLGEARQLARAKANHARNKLHDMEQELAPLHEDSEIVEDKLIALKHNLIALGKSENDIAPAKAELPEIDRDASDENSIVRILQLWQSMFRDTFLHYHRLFAALVRSGDAATALRLWQEYLQDLQSFLASNVPSDYENLTEHRRLCGVHRNLLASQRSVLVLESEAKKPRDQQFTDKFDTLTNLHNETLARIVERHDEVCTRIAAWNDYREICTDLLQWLKDIEREKEKLQLRYVHMKTIHSVLNKIQNLSDKIPEGRKQCERLFNTLKKVLEFTEKSYGTSVRMEYAGIVKRVDNLQASLETWREFLSRIIALIGEYESRGNELQKLYSKTQDEICNYSDEERLSRPNLKTAIEKYTKLKTQIDKTETQIEALSVIQEQLKECLSPQDIRIVNQRVWQLRQQRADLEHQLSIIIYRMRERLEIYTIFESRLTRFSEWITPLESRLETSSQTGEISNLDPQDLIRKINSEVQAETTLKEREFEWIIETGNNLIEQSRKDEKSYSQKTEKKLHNIQERWNRLLETGKARIVKINDLLDTIAQLEERLSEIRLKLHEIESRLSAPIVLEEMTVKAVDGKSKERDEIQKRLESESGEVGETLNLCELVFNDPEILRANFDLRNLRTGVDIVERKWNNLCEVSNQHNNTLKEIRHIIETTFALLPKVEKKLDSVEKRISKIETRKQRGEPEDESVSRAAIKDLEALEGDIKCLEDGYSKLVAARGLELRGTGADEAARLRKAVRRWQQLRGRIDAVGADAHRQFVAAHGRTVVALAEADVRLTRALHLSPTPQDKVATMKELEGVELELRECQALVEDADRLAEALSGPSVADMVAEYHALYADVRARLDASRAEITSDVDTGVQVDTLKWETDAALQVDTLTAKETYRGELTVAVREAKDALEVLSKTLKKPIKENATSDELAAAAKEIAKIGAKPSQPLELAKHLSELLLTECDATEDEAMLKDVESLVLKHEDLLPQAQKRELQINNLRLPHSASYALTCEHESGRITCPLCSDRNWKQLDNDLWRLEQWLQYAEATEASRTEIPEQYDALEDTIQNHREFLLDLDSHKSLVVSLNVVGTHVAQHAASAQAAADLRSRLAAANARWNAACESAAVAQKKLQRALVHNQQFHDIVVELVARLAAAERGVRAREPLRLSRSAAELQRDFRKFSELRDELERTEPRVHALHDAAQLLRSGDAPPHSDDICRRLAELRLRLQSLRKLSGVYALKLGAALAKQPAHGSALAAMVAAAAPAQLLDGDDGQMSGLDLPPLDEKDMVVNEEAEDQELSNLQRGLRFVCRVARASLPFQALLLLLLGAAALAPHAHSDCRTPGLAFEPVLRYPDGPPPL